MIQRDTKATLRPVNGECTVGIAAARRGSSRELGVLLERYRFELLELAESELGSTIGPKASASDIVQEALLDAVSDFGRFQGQTDEELRGWLRQIVRNRSVDVGRRYRHAEKRDIARELPLDEHLRQELAAPGASPSALVSLDESARRMQEAMNRLPEPHRTILQLRHRDGKSFVEIGTAQKCSQFRARRAWYEALLLLQRELEEQA